MVLLQRYALLCIEKNFEFVFLAFCVSGWTSHSDDRKKESLGAHTAHTRFGCITCIDIKNSGTRVSATSSRTTKEQKQKMNNKIPFIYFI